MTIFVLFRDYEDHAYGYFSSLAAANDFIQVSVANYRAWVESPECTWLSEDDVQGYLEGFYIEEHTLDSAEPEYGKPSGDH